MPKFWKSYFGAADPLTAADIEPALWNSVIGVDHYTDSGEKYRAAIFEQYKLYVEMADRISARRALANTFFLTLHGVIFTLVGALWSNKPGGSPLLMLFPLVLLLSMCAAWFWLVRSYRQLSSGKFAVVAAFERRLPALPYSDGEWKALGEGRDKSRYWPLTHLEQWIPALFAVTYVVGFITILIIG